MQRMADVAYFDLRRLQVLSLGAADVCCSGYLEQRQLCVDFVDLFVVLALYLVDLFVVRDLYLVDLFVALAFHLAYLNIMGSFDLTQLLYMVVLGDTRLNDGSDHCSSGHLH
jgi:hypothetical protein